MQNTKIDIKVIIYIIFYLMLLLEIAPIIPRQIRSFLNMNRQIKELKKKINQFEHDVKLETVLNSDKDNAAKAVSGIEARIASLDDSALISSYISSSARAANIDVHQIITAKPQAYLNTTEGVFFNLPIKIEAKTSFHDLGRFLNIIESGPYWLQTQELFIKESSPYHLVRISLMALLKER